VVKDPATRSWRFLLVYVVPTFLILLWFMAPLIRGSHTLYLRDVLNAHLEKKWVQAEAMADGYLPLLDPYRDGGQPLAGNPNAAAFYPDNVLLLVASPIWVLNSHFWFHLLLAPFSVFWLARSWGLRKEAAWAAGVLYVSGGFFLSMLNLYNMVAGIALAPAFIAAMIELSNASLRASRLAAVAILWCLLLLGGDPMIAAMALVLAFSAALTQRGWRGISWRWSLTGVGLGFALALPQLVEFIRILPLTYRGYWGFSPEAATVGSWHPMTALELLLPFAFGKPDLTFWGKQFYSGSQPLLLTLYPGIVALFLLLLSGKPRSRVSWWSLGALGVGMFLVLGSYNPIVSLLWRLPGASLLRLPIKFWLLIAIGGSLLGALGFQRFVDRERNGPPVGLALGALGLLFLAGWGFLTVFSVDINQWLRTLIPSTFPDEMVNYERTRWAGLALLSLIALAAVAVLWRFGRRWPAVVGGGVLLTHLLFQFTVLRPIVAIDEVAPYMARSQLLDVIQAGANVMYGKSKEAFGTGEIPLREYPDYRTLWLQRQIFSELYPSAGIMAGRRYAFSVSPEGLDSFLTRITGKSFAGQKDLGRIRLLAASGVEYLLLHRELDPSTSGEVDLIARSPTVGGGMFVYRILGPAAEVALVGNVRRAPHLNAALTWMVSDDFDPRTDTVFPEGGPALRGPPGSVSVVTSGPEELAVQTDSPVPGALVVQRAFLPLYRATIDGEKTPIVAANIHRLGIELPPGEHQVRIWVDRRPLKISTAVAILALAALSWLVWRLRSSTRELV